MTDVEASRAAGLERTAGPLLIMLAAPPFALMMWSTLARHDGSLAALLSEGIDWPRPSLAAFAILLGFAVFQALLVMLLPGRTVLGPPTPAGARMRYTDNAALAWTITHIAFLALLFSGLMPPGLIFDELGALLLVGSIAGILGTALLYAKGRLAASGADRGPSGNAVFDFYWGIELHPRIGGLDLKLLAISRVGMMGWSLIVLSLVARDYWQTGAVTNALAVSAALQIAYVARFMWWEAGYIATLDIAHDRFGFYLLWGVLGWLPAIYPSAALYLAAHPVALGTLPALALLAIGGGALVLTHLADAQRQRVRASDGQCLVWGRRPDVIRVRYHSLKGSEEGLLLVSGFWGLARHFNYASEILLALAWTLPCGSGALLPYFYPAYLAVMLVHRALRDDRRCRRKYGASWDAYCARVPYRMLPGIF
jgi:7-dehydrocholesterol reductase